MTYARVVRVSKKGQFVIPKRDRAVDKILSADGG